MNIKGYVSILLGAVLWMGCGSEKEPHDPISYLNYVDPQIIASAEKFFTALPDEAKSVDFESSFDRVKLGRKLYLDNRLSKNGNQSCNTCHNLDTYGVDNLPTSPGDKGENGERNSPTTLNAALHFVQFWDGRSPHVEDQAGGPIVNPVEMAMPSEEYVVNRLKGIEDYQTSFTKAFPKDDDPITYDNLKIALGAFERTLLTPSRFDEFMQGNTEALTTKEIAGLDAFVKTGCTTCHTGALLGGGMYQPFGVYGDYWTYTKSEKIDEGRFVVTGNESDKYVFKVPSLRNIEKTAPYFHDGSIASLEKAILIMAKSQLNKELKAEEVENIAAFLKSLTGETPGV
jgi:cytochrome c peroxidase